MSTVEEIKAAIDRLSLSERAEIAKWLNGWQDDEWDRQMAADARAGKFDRILQEVDREIREGKLRDLP
jgi:hypothetical protein